MSNQHHDMLPWALVTFTVLLVVAAAFYAIWPYIQSHVTVHVGDGVYRARVADSENERIRGLSGTPSLRKDEALLLVYPTDGKHAIWMKDMHYPIDIVWMDKDKKIVHIVKNVPPDSYPDKYAPNELARYVLELPAGAVNEKSIAVGMTASFDESRSEGWLQ